MTAKQRLEASGWRVVHGIVDSIWVTPDPDVNDEDREDLDARATEIADCVEIRLEHGAHYDWVAFVPQRSTPPFIEDVQRDCLERLDASRSPDAVLDCLQDAIKRLHAGTEPVEQLVERNRVSKPLEGNTKNKQSVAALKRARDQDLAIYPGQDIE